MISADAHVFWFILFIFQLSISFYFYKLYTQDKNKKTVLFLIGFSIISYSHLYEVFTPSVFGQTPLTFFTAVQYWSFYPLLFALAIVIHDHVLKSISAEKIVKIFIGLIFLCFPLFTFNPVLTQDYIGLIGLFIGVYLIIAGVIKTVKTKNISDGIFLLSLISYLTGSLGLLGYLNESLAIFSFFTGDIYLIILFSTLKKSETKQKSFIDNYIHIKKELETVKTELTEKEETFQTLFNFMPDPVMILDKKGTFIELTERVKEFTGFERNEILGQNFLQTKLLTPKSKAICIKNLMKRMAGVPVKPYEVEALTKNGERIPFEVNATRINYQGQPADMVVFRDISERKESQREIQESEERYRSIYEQSGDGVFVVDFDGTIVDVNQKMTALFGHSKKDFLKFSFSQMFHSGNKQSVKNTLNRMFTEDSVRCKMDFVRKDNSVFKGELNSSIVMIQGKQYIQGIIRDYTKEEKRKKEIQFLSEVANQFVTVDDTEVFDLLGSVMKQLTGNSVVSVNTLKNGMFEIKKIFGVKQRTMQLIDAVLGSRPLSSPIKGLNEETEQVLFSGNLTMINGGLYEAFFGNVPKSVCAGIEKMLGITSFYSIGLRRKDKLYGSVTILVRHDNKLNKEAIETVVSQASVVLEKKESFQKIEELNNTLEEKVRDRTKEIQHLLKQKDDFINQLGHDLKNPLGPFIHLLPVLKKHVVLERDKKIIDVLNRNAKYMQGLVKKTIELAKLNSSRTKFSFQQIFLNDVIDTVLSTNSSFLDKHHVSVKNKVMTPLLVHVDEIHIQEVFTNLLTNAVKYSEEPTQIVIDAEVKDDELLVSVKDNGIGLSEEQLNYLFDEYYKADSSRHDFDSSGLGLPICKRIVEKHDGEIWAESKGLGKGSTFYFTVPLAE